MSGKIILLDTNAIGLFLDKNEFINKHIALNSSIIISIISQIEFLSNPKLTPKNKFIFESFIETIHVCDVDVKEVSLIQTIISIRKKYKLKLPDAIIAATALTNEALLMSADNGFAKIHNLNFKLIK